MEKGSSIPKQKNPLLKLILTAIVFLFAFLSFLLFLTGSLWNKNISEQQAINIVKNLPEVNKYFKEGNRDAPPFIRAEERKDNYWYIQVGSITPATEGIISHSATFNWYKLDKKNGKIACSMFLYDNKGKFLGSGETKSICIHDQNVIQKLSETETASWQGKITDWLGRIYDVNNAGNEYIDKDLKITSSTGWVLPNKPYIISKRDLVKNGMGEGKSWESIPVAKDTLGKAGLSSTQRQYFYDNNYVPRSVERFDVTEDGIPETIVTSLTLGCGRCVDFYMTIFTDDGKYNARTGEGTIIKAENGNGFYLTNYYGSGGGATIYINKYKWDKSLFTEIARKEITLEPKN